VPTCSSTGKGDYAINTRTWLVDETVSLNICMGAVTYRDVFNVFLGAMLGGSVLSELSTYVNYPAEIWKTLASAIPASSNFFINYVAVSGSCRVS
jgi:Calcium-dependent channel, 7TM region, putative phosphate